MSQAQVTRAESIEGHGDSRVDADKKPKSRRPANTAFRQQRLKAWQPILTPKSVLPLFFVVGILFAPIGGVLLWASSQVQEIVIDYTNCPTEALNTTADIPTSYVSTTWKAQSSQQSYWWKSWNSTSQNWVCHLSFYVPESMGPPVFMYYRLTNFYQNHRRYVQSLDLEQLKGEPVPNNTISSSPCSPLAMDPVTGKAYYPCGLIANSMFNDTISSPVFKGESDVTYNMTNKGIAWESDKALIKQSQYNKWQVVPPPNWKDYNYETQGLPDLHENEEFMVWMRTAGLPSFSKLARRNDQTAMQPGRYQMSINYKFPVKEYAGTKSILLSTRTALGGKNPFMGIAYVVVGGVCVLLGALFTIAYLIRPRKLGDHTYLTWDSSSNQQSTAMASGRDDRMRPNAP